MTFNAGSGIRRLQSGGIAVVLAAFSESWTG
jgi:hypothetical protein